MLVLEIVVSVLQPDPDITLGLLPDLERVNVAAIDRSGMPLNAGEAADAGKHTAEQFGVEPSRIERADSAGRIACDGAAVGIAAEVVLFADIRQDLVAQEARIGIVDRVVLDAAHPF